MEHIFRVKFFFFRAGHPKYTSLRGANIFQKTSEEARGPKTIKVNTFYIIGIIKTFVGAQGQKRPEEGPPWEECQPQHKTGHPIGTMPKPA